MAGRPKKSTTKATTEIEEVVVETKEKEEKENNSDAIIAELMRQVQSLTEKLNEKEQSKVETVSKTLPTKVKVISLIPNQYNLSTMEGGSGKVFSFPKMGSTVIMRTSELEDVLSVSKYREQAENGYFYICDSDVVEELGLDYSNICDDKMMKDIISLKDDNSVNLFCGLSNEVKQSVATKMAEDLADGKRLDRNRLHDIKKLTDIDIEKKSEELIAVREALTKDKE